MTQVNGKDYTYDKNGNLIDDGKRTYTYDAENRLTAVKEGAKTLASYTYRADGMRKSMTTDSGTLVSTMMRITMSPMRQTRMVRS
ncbi:hypothetical protein [Marininema halotolerans]|uniref:hypothetical protein n=1 Tax=Marininema halotolerans TaxID=1155944 RepID=UPI000B86725D|nr:hypothetical protein [Marininema halotolerans]